MVAEFKSHILKREEKGLFGVPLKRLLLSGVISGLGYTVVQMLSRQWSIPLGVVLAIAVLILRGERGGLPLGARLLYRLRGSILLQAAKHPGGVAAQIAQTFNLPVGLVRLDASQFFTADTAEIDMREWVTFRQASEEDGLVFVDSPLEDDDAR